MPLDPSFWEDDEPVVETLPGPVVHGWEPAWIKLPRNEGTFCRVSFWTNDRGDPLWFEKQHRLNNGETFTRFYTVAALFIPAIPDPPQFDINSPGVAVGFVGMSRMTLDKIARLARDHSLRDHDVIVHTEMRGGGRFPNYHVQATSTLSIPRSTSIYAYLSFLAERILKGEQF